MFWGSSAAATRLLPSLTADIVRLRPRPAPGRAQGCPGYRRQSARGAATGSWTERAPVDVSHPRCRSRLPGCHTRCHGRRSRAAAHPGEGARHGNRRPGERRSLTSRAACVTSERRARIGSSSAFVRDGEPRLLLTHVRGRPVDGRPRSRVVSSRPPLGCRREPPLVVARSRQRTLRHRLDGVPGAQGDRPLGRLERRRLRSRSHRIGTRRVRQQAGHDRHV